MSIITLSPEMRQLISGGELWDAGTPNSAYRGRIDNARLFSPSGSTTLTTAKVGNAYTFPNGANSSLSIPRDNALWLPSSGTLAFWLNVDLNAWYASQALVWLVDVSGNQTLGVRAEPGTGWMSFRFLTSTGTRFLFTTSFALSAGWHHFVYQWQEDAGTWPVSQVWIDGVKYANSGSANGIITRTGFSTNVVINRPTNQTDVRIEQLMMLPQILSDASVSHLYNSGNGMAWGVHRAIPDDFLSTQIG